MKNLVTKTALTVVTTLILAVSANVSVAQGNAAAGANKVAVCAGCHGTAGDSQIAANPKLAGQNARYLFKQLQDIKSGARTVVLMTGILNSSNEQDLQDMAAYFAEQDATVEGADPALVELGQSIYRSGIADLSVAACTACHSPSGQGNSQAGFPAVGGQHAEYLATQLKAFRSGERTNDGTTMPMRIVTERLTDKEIDALASFISGLH